jgi:hypothetical protein
MALGFEDASELDFSDVQTLLQLQPVETSRYFTELGITTQEFRVPDLPALFKTYSRLGHGKKKRFLRSCASLSAACEPGLNESQKVVALVTSIEPLLDVPERCDACGGQTGITRLFRKFLEEYVHPSPAVKDLYEGVYAARSKIVHGGWRIEVDEPFFGLRPQSDLVPLAAWNAAKRGVMNWLLSQ